MIKFFRRIRKELLEENRLSKYLVYAGGEIILVMIGILLALQINNWNEQRKSDAFENEILTEIRANLIKDKLVLKDIILNTENAKSSIDKILAEDVSLIVNDSIKYWLGDVVRFDRYRPLTNAYEVLKSQGVDKVTNKQLRFLLGMYYDDKSIEAITGSLDLEKMFMDDWLPILKTNIVKVELGKLVELQDYADLQTGGVIRNLLILNRENLRNSNMNFTTTSDHIDKILDIINTELDD